MLACFSLTTNLKTLTNDENNPNVIYCIDGIRALSLIWVIVGHTLYGFYSMPGVNPIEMVHWADVWQSKIVISSPLSVDSFFVITGFLISYLTMKTLDKEGKLNIPLFYIHRYIR